jgi:vacuolar protein sorting-associated protein 72
MADAKRKTAQELAAQRQERLQREGQRKGVELRRLTQEDILLEAKQTEIINRARLHTSLAVPCHPCPPRCVDACPRHGSLSARARAAGASLEAMLRVEEEKRRVVTRDRSTDVPMVRWRSVRNGEAVQNTISFVDCPLPAELGSTAPAPPVPMRCAVTGLPAKYFDPGTNCPYATLDAFRMLRGRTGRRGTLV